LWNSGTNNATTPGFDLGYLADTGLAASHTSEAIVTENHGNSGLLFEESTDYDGSSDPRSSGSWSDIGANPPDNSGTPGTDGFDVVSLPRYVRVNLGSLFQLSQKFHRAKVWTGTRRSNDLV